LADTPAQIAGPAADAAAIVGALLGAQIAGIHREIAEIERVIARQARPGCQPAAPPDEWRCRRTLQAAALARPDVRGGASRMRRRRPRHRRRSRLPARLPWTLTTASRGTGPRVP